MPYIIGASVTGGVSKDFEPEIDRRLMAVVAISKPTLEERDAIPRTLRIGRPKGKELSAIFGWMSGPFIVSSRLRDILEELEPGRHDFLPIAVNTEREFQGTTDHGTYYLILSPPRLDAVIVEETDFAKGYGREGFEKSGGTISHLKEHACVLNSEVIEGHHFWQLPEDFGARPENPFSGRTAYFCSDELWRRIRAEKMKGWDIEKVCRVNVYGPALDAPALRPRAFERQRN
jgi:hypothetical protein